MLPALSMSTAARRIAVQARCLASLSASARVPIIPGATKTAAACIIANEVLTGKVHDVNTHKLASFCFDNGISLSRVEIVPDVESDIIRSVQTLSANYDLVFTSGGIGPTHDDITYQSIAKAFGLKLEHNAEIIKLMEAHYAKRNMQLTEPIKRMALLPTPAKLLKTDGLWVPLVVVAGNVYILPGVPMLFSKMLDAAQPLLATAHKFTRRILYTSLFESQIANAMTQATIDIPSVSIGSYPRFNDDHVRVMISFEGSNEADVLRCVEAIQAQIQGFDSESACRAASEARRQAKQKPLSD
ncbi:molybdopterin binding domain-containing protein [Capsaspora owczarzaki ATCC 30864]|uniref:Molybdopterin binding domain-containing protein n=1 Tax=Capsaspora owczarzaki (strain ATCC 30864) TaxID=595528 RepID=A0A0D2VMK3_CAPO3|nr:molybdopterin binding domain-containing protein [Capsaspora owczarzaki ATCC 30864]KJE91402.1 molybdopterin binding domain-containing protein [Capsaspora owczarzaki ATCC 30864]|eukprot:XP_004349289.2 molybdopterin binding domain-containing protein [Capsaspora owczarzaki ATCC 30864]